MSGLIAPVDDLNALIGEGRFSGPVIDGEILRELGFFLLKGAIPAVVIQRYHDLYAEQLASGVIQKSQHHLTEVRFTWDNPLVGIAHEPAFVDAASRLFAGNVGVDFVRVVKKDATNTAPVFLHQDLCYQAGSFQRYSFFISLTSCHPQNGGLTVYPGTHHFGYLGDAGEIGDILPAGYPQITPDQAPGDILVMHSALWHKSGENHARTPRVYLEVHVQDANDTTTKRVISGQRTSKWSNPMDWEDLFVNSRTQRLKTLYKTVEDLKEQSKARQS
jgi:hypothetical protein